ncbi:MAG: hypothetical protein EBZ49_12350, partial [Proteobacteria bacterium]|nr:hypothetical protein [Pseudomonadota bacterium]
MEYPLRCFIFIFASLVFFTGCSGGLRSPVGISGVVQLGRVKNAMVRVYALSETGTRVEPFLEQTTTNQNGEFNLNTSLDRSGPLEIVASGAHGNQSTYIDESSLNDGVVREIALQPSDELSALVDKSSSNRVAITPISHYVAKNILQKIRGQGLSQFATQKNQAHSEIASLWGLDPDDMEVVPANPDNLEGASLKELKVAFSLFVLSQYLEDKGEKTGSPVALIDALSEDLLDGVLDGQNNSGLMSLSAPVSLRSLASSSARVKALTDTWAIGMESAKTTVISQFPIFSAFGM